MTREPGSLAILFLDRQPIFEVSIACQIFGTAPPGAEAWYDVRICADDGPRGVPLRGSSGHADLPGLFTLNATHGLEDLVTAQTVIVPAAGNVHEEPPAAVLSALRAAHRNGARMISLCSGAFVLAAAGLLDGRRATCHWEHAELLRERYPDVDVDQSVLYIDDGDVLSGAGNCAGIDLCLHVIRRDLGVETASSVARRMIVPPHRAGGQAQYVDSALPSRRDGSLGKVLDWAIARIDEPLAVSDLAAVAGVGIRTLIRRFHSELGTTPRDWLQLQRLSRARELLERTDLSVDKVAQNSGLGTAPNLRLHFSKELGISPSEYRRNHRAAVS